MKIIAILIILLTSGPVLAGEEAWIANPKGCERASDSFDDILGAISNPEITKQYGLELIKYETGDQGRTMVVRTLVNYPNNYMVYADSESLCKRMIDIYNQQNKIKENSIASTATQTTAEDNVRAAYSATFSDHCKTLPGNISFESLRSKIYQLASKKPDDYRVTSDKEYPGGKIFSFISPDGGGNVTNNIDFCNILLTEIINETNKNTEDNSPISRNEIWVVDGKKLRCVRAKPLEPYDRLKWVLRDRILIKDSNTEGRTIITRTEEQSVTYVDNEQLCRSIIAAGKKQNFNEQNAR